MRARTRPAAAPLLAALLATPSADEIARAGLTNLRRLALLLTACLGWSFAVAPVALAATPQAQAPRPAPVRPLTTAQIRQTLAEIEATRARSAAVPTVLRPDLRPVRPRPAARAASPPLSQPLSLLDQVGHLVHPLDPADVPAWKAELKAGGQGTPLPTALVRRLNPAGGSAHPGPRAALLHLWLGEAALARDQRPRLAQWHFRQVERLTKPASPLYGRAAYDGVMALFYEGAYQDAALQFRRLLVHGQKLRGFERRDCVLWMRHAAACAGYHDQHAKLGIPEPPQLDPLCGAAALAAGLRALGRPSGKNTLLRAVRPTGEGSTLADLVAAGPRLGVSVRALTADDRGLVALPKPLVAFVEQDHFVAVVGAGKSGVSYLCSDCGPWPGGRVDLTWRQWHALSPGTYAAVLARGSDWDRALAALSRPAGPKPVAAPVRVSSAGPLAALRLSVRAHLALALPALAGHVVMTLHPGAVTCGSKPPALPCLKHVHCVYLCRKGDPVNLATGEEEYQPEPDLTVYNPVGPSVTWQREYRSLRGPGQDGSSYTPDSSYEAEDFGVGWSQGYNMGVTNPDASTGHNGYASFNQGTTDPLQNPKGAYSPYGTADTWEIHDGAGVEVASNNPAYGTPNGWSVTYISANNYTVTIPSNAAAGTYSWSYQQAGSYFFGGLVEFFGSFNVTAAGPTAGAKAIFFPNGSRVTFTAPQVPTSSTPAVACAVQAGAPYLVSWVYVAGSPWGQFVVTDATRTRWIMGNASAIGPWVLAQEVDRNGNVLTFHYGAPLMETVPSESGTVTVPLDGFPLLTSVTNAAGTALLTVSRATDNTGNVTQISDCYGRSVYYSTSTHANNLPQAPSYAQSYQEVDQVSQVVATGTSSAPQRWAYGYTNISNTEGSEQVEFLTTITAPSPTGSGSAVTTINYDSSTDLVQSVSDADGGTASITSTDANGNASYPSNYTTVTVTGGGMAPYTHTAGFDSNMSETSETDGAGHAVYTVDSFDPSDPYEPAQTHDGNGNATNNVYDPFGNLLRTTSPRGTVTNYAYAYPAAVYPLVQGLPNTQERDGAFGLGELVSAQEGGKTPTSYAYYEPSGLVQTVTGPRPGTAGAAAIVLASYAYDGLGNVTDVTRPGPNSTAGNTSTYVTTAMNYTSDGGYGQADALGQPLTVTDPLGHTTHLRYDARGNRTAQTDAAGNETDFTFNIDDRPLATVYPATGQSGSGRGSTLDAYLYEANNDPAQQYGPLVSVQTFDEGNTAGAFRTVSYAYDQAGQTTGVSGSTEPVTYTYDGQYRLSSLTDGAGHTTHYFYRPEGYLLQVAYPGSGATTGPLAAGTPDTVSYTWYDGAGNLRTRVDGNNTLTTYTYADPESRLTGVHYSPGSGVASLADTSYSYDAYGRRSAMTGGAGGQSYTYADDDALTADTTTYAGLPARTVSYAFDPDGSRSSMSTPAGTFSYGYDNAGRMTGLTNPFEAYPYAFTYYANGWLQMQQSSNVLQAAYTYNARGQMTDLNNHRTDGYPLSEFAVPAQGGYDGAGNRKALAASLPAAPGYGGSTAYAYDGRNELTGETSTRNGGYALSHAYDGAGNPTTFRSSAVGAASADNQLPGSTYDGDGSPTAYRGAAATYDPEGRLVGLGGVANTYDGDGLRASKNAGGLTYFLYDGEQPVCELNSSGAVVAVHTFGPNGLLARHTSSGSALYTWDLSGNLAQREDTNGNGIDSALSDGFGAVSSTDNSPDPFSGFGGQWGGYTDAAQAGQTGLTLFTHRFYDPATGRFLTRDPLGYAGGINLYGYTQNDPTNRNDPEGLSENVGNTQGDAELQNQINVLNQELNGGGLTAQERAEIQKEINALKQKIITNEKARGDRNKRKRRPNKFVQCPPKGFDWLPVLDTGLPDLSTSLPLPGLLGAGALGAGLGEGAAGAGAGAGAGGLLGDVLAGLGAAGAL